MAPGATELTRMPRGPSICASEAEEFAVAALIAEYGASEGSGVSALTEEVAMIEPPASGAAARS